MGRKRIQAQIVDEQTTNTKTVEGELFSSEPDWADQNLQDMLTEGMIANSPSELTDTVIEEMWKRSSGWTPLEYLTYTYRNPWKKDSDRINAAKAVLEYVHKKVGNTVEVNVKKIPPSGLSKLSDKELAALTKLLEKMEEGSSEEV